MLDKLSSCDYKTALRRTQAQRYGSTGQWLVYTQQFTEWVLQNSLQTFWCHGKLGSGKTILTGFAVEHLVAEHSQAYTKIVYFFCQYDNEMSLQATTMVGSIIRQLLDQDTNLFRKNEHKVRDLVEQKHVELAQLESLLLDILADIDRTVMILDGLDECSDKEMKLIIKTLRSIKLQGPPGLKLYLAGDDRINDLITTFIEPAFVVHTQSTEATSDIEELVKQLVLTKKEDGDLKVGDMLLYDDIVETLSTGAQGMFVSLSKNIRPQLTRTRILWVKFQLEEVCLQKTDQSIRDALTHLPKDLFGTYNRLLSRIVEENGTDLCTKIFRWTAAVKRPLKLEELREAIAVELGQDHIAPDRMINDTKAIPRWCHGLVTLDELDGVLRFTHSSIKDFLCDCLTANMTLLAFHFSQQEADREIGAICVTYLNFSDFKTQVVKRPRQFNNPVLLSPMVIAAHALTPKTSSSFLNIAGGLMGVGSKPSSVDPGIFLSHTRTNSKGPTPTQHPFLSYASKFWLPHTAGIDPAQSTLWRSWRALVEGEISIIESPSVLDASEQWYNPLLGAPLRKFILLNRHGALLQLFLSNNTPFAADQRHYALNNLLISALHEGCTSFVEPFLQKEEYPPRPLWLRSAILAQNMDLIQTLVDSGGEWAAELTVEERSELYQSIPNAHEERLSLKSKLIDFGIDIYYHQHSRSMTILEQEIRYGRPSLLEQMCRSTIASGVDLNRGIADRDRKAIHIAAMKAKLSELHQLLAVGCDIQAIDEDGSTALHLTISDTRPNDKDDMIGLSLEPEGTMRAQVIQFLINQGIDTKITNKRGKTAWEYNMPEHMRKQVAEIYIVSIPR